MVYVIFPFDPSVHFKEPEGFKFIQLSPNPLVQLHKIIKPAKHEDIFVLIPENFQFREVNWKKMIEVYCSYNVHVMSSNYDELHKNFYLDGQERLRDSDIVIFKRSYIRSGLTDISQTSPYNKIRSKLVRLGGGGSLYVPIDRRDPATPVVMARSSTPLPDLQLVKGNVYHVSINLGIGDMLYTRGTLDTLKEKYSKIVLSPYIDLYKEVISPTREDMIFTNSLLNLIFKPPFYHIDQPNQRYPHRFAYTFHVMDGLPITKPDLADELCEGEPLNIGPYVLISTRIREITKKEYDKDIKKPLMASLKKLSEKYKVVVMGERSLKKCLQHNVCADFMFIIYDDIKRAVPKDRLVDLTFSSIDEIKDDRLKKFRQECLYMRDAEWNITLGNGGNFCMATAVGKVIGYYTPTNKIDATPFAFNGKSYPGVHVFNELKKFFAKIDSLFETKPELKIKVNMGVGDLLLIRSMLDYQKDKYSKIHITPNATFFDVLRTPEYKDGFIKDYIEMLFKDDYYVIDNNQSYPRKNTETLYWENKIPFVGPQYMKDEFCKGAPLNIGKYLTLTTKIRALDKSHYEKIKKDFFNVISLISNKYKIVVIGEKTLPDWPEYKNGTTPDVFMIYNDIMSFLPKENIIDMTYNCTKSGSTLSQLQQDCVYMRDAYYNIILGLGGGFCLAMTCGRILGFWQEHKNFEVTKLYEICTKLKSNMYMTRNIEKYIEWISEL